MYRDIRRFCVIFAVLAQCGGYVYTPCELVREIYGYRNSNWSRIELSDLPLVTCIAGYRSYDTNKKPQYTAAGEATGYYGMFGIPSWEIKNCKSHDDPSPVYHSNLVDPRVGDDLKCVKNIIFESPDLLDLYKRMCSPHLVLKMMCQIDVNTNVEAWDPFYKHTFSLDILSQKNEIYKFMAYVEELQVNATVQPSPFETMFSSELGYLAQAITLLQDSRYLMLILMLSLIQVLIHFLLVIGVPAMLVWWKALLPYDSGVKDVLHEGIVKLGHLLEPATAVVEASGYLPRPLARVLRSSAAKYLGGRSGYQPNQITDSDNQQQIRTETNQQ